MIVFLFSVFFASASSATLATDAFDQAEYGVAVAEYTGIIDSQGP